MLSQSFDFNNVKDTQSDSNWNIFYNQHIKYFLQKSPSKVDKLVIANIVVYILFCRRVLFR